MERSTVACDEVLLSSHGTLKRIISSKVQAQKSELQLFNDDTYTNVFAHVKVESRVSAKHICNKALLNCTVCY